MSVDGRNRDPPPPHMCVCVCVAGKVADDEREVCCRSDPTRSRVMMAY
jgi:hypothetical protein